MRFGWFLRSRSPFDSKSILARAIEVCRNPEECFWFRLCYQITVRWIAAPVERCCPVWIADHKLILVFLISTFFSLSLSLALSPPPPPPLSVFLDNFVYHCNSRICRIHFIFVYFVPSGFRTKIKCVLKVQIESSCRASAVVSNCTKASCVGLQKVGGPQRTKI